MMFAGTKTVVFIRRDMFLIEDVWGGGILTLFVSVTELRERTEISQLIGEFVWTC